MATTMTLEEMAASWGPVVGVPGRRLFVARVPLYVELSAVIDYEDTQERARLKARGYRWGGRDSGWVLSIEPGPEVREEVAHLLARGYAVGGTGRFAPWEAVVTLGLPERFPVYVTRWATGNLPAWAKVVRDNADEMGVGITWDGPEPTNPNETRTGTMTVDLDAYRRWCDQHPLD